MVQLEQMRVYGRYSALDVARRLARELEADAGCTFEESLQWHMANGIVISRPSVFVMARFAESAAFGTEAFDDLQVRWRRPDCLWLDLAVGSLPGIWQAVPKLPFYGWRKWFKRNGRVYAMKDVERMVALCR